MTNEEYAQDNGGKRSYASKDQYGLTKRELFAAMAMQGAGAAAGWEPKKTAEMAVHVADALLLALEVK